MHHKNYQCINVLVIFDSDSHMLDIVAHYIFFFHFKTFSTFFFVILGYCVQNSEVKMNELIQNVLNPFWIKGVM